MVFVKTDGTFEDVKLSLENIIFEAEAGDGLQVNTASGHVLSVKIDEDSEDYLTVSENGVKVSGIDEQFEVTAAALNDLNDRVLANKEAIETEKTIREMEVIRLDERIDEVAGDAISVQGTAQQIKVTNGTGTAKVIGFADDAVFDCGEF